MRIIEEKAKVTSGCGGLEGYDAEVTVEEIKDGMVNEYYVHANAFEGVYYTVATTSMYDYMTNLTDEEPGEIDYMEEYESIKDAKASRFYKYIKIADRMLKEIGNFEE